MYHTIGIMKRPSLTIPFFKPSEEYDTWVKQENCHEVLH